MVLVTVMCVAWYGVVSGIYGAEWYGVAELFMWCDMTLCLNGVCGVVWHGVVDGCVWCSMVGSWVVWPSVSWVIVWLVVVCHESV